MTLRELLDHIREVALEEDLSDEVGQAFLRALDYLQEDVNFAGVMSVMVEVFRHRPELLSIILKQSGYMPQMMPSPMVFPTNPETKH